MTREELDSLVPFETDVLYKDREWNETLKCKLNYIDGNSVFFVSGGGNICTMLDCVLSDDWVIAGREQETKEMTIEERAKEVVDECIERCFTESVKDIDGMTHIIEKALREQKRVYEEAIRSTCDEVKKNLLKEHKVNDDLLSCRAKYFASDYRKSFRKNLAAKVSEDRLDELETISAKSYEEGYRRAFNDVMYDTSSIINGIITKIVL